MCPAVPRITSAPSLVLPYLECAQRPAVGEMLAQELAQEPLVRAARGLVHVGRLASLDPGGECLARARRQHAASRLQPRAASADQPSGGVAEHDGTAPLDRRVA